jgi:tripartite-type tricarboxylate transporter receptor subunit TctC
VPTGVPRNIVLRLNAEINKALISPELSKSTAERGGILIGGTPEFAADFVRRETEKWGKIIKTAGIKPQ